MTSPFFDGQAGAYERATGGDDFGDSVLDLDCFAARRRACGLPELNRKDNLKARNRRLAWAHYFACSSLRTFSGERPIRLAKSSRVRSGASLLVVIEKTGWPRRRLSSGS